MEEGTLAFWASDDTFRKSIEMLATPVVTGSNEPVFYDGAASQRAHPNTVTR